MLDRGLNTPLLHEIIYNQDAQTLRKICKSTDFYQRVFSRIRTEVIILSLYRIIQLSENTYSHIFYTVRLFNNLWVSYILN